MKRLEFTCDGCDAIERCDVPPSGNVTDYMLEGWIAHRLISEENGVRTNDFWAELCPNCSQKLRLAINPARWSKPDPVVRELAKRPAISLA